MSVKPIKPSEVTKAKHQQLPDFVIQVFNEHIAKKCGAYRYKAATVNQKEVVDDIIVAMGKLDQYREVSYENRKAEIFREHWLDVEEVYREAGWSVEYDKPGYNENYGAFWIFKEI